MISTRDLRRLPDLRPFRRLTRALAMLDAILSPDWERRYYSFNAHWTDGEMMAAMRNGSGDHWFALLCPAGIVVHGLAHAAPNGRHDAAQRDLARSSIPARMSPRRPAGLLVTA